MEKLINQIKESSSQLIEELSKLDRTITIDLDEYWEFPSFVVVGDIGYTHYYITSINDGQVGGVDLDSGDEYVSELTWLSITELITLAEFLLD